jgi:hypothetical protein
MTQLKIVLLCWNKIWNVGYIFMNFIYFSQHQRLLYWTSLIDRFCNRYGVAIQIDMTSSLCVRFMRFVQRIKKKTAWVSSTTVISSGLSRLFPRIVNHINEMCSRAHCPWSKVVAVTGQRDETSDLLGAWPASPPPPPATPAPSRAPHFFLFIFN